MDAHGLQKSTPGTNDAPVHVPLGITSVTPIPPWPLLDGMKAPPVATSPPVETTLAAPTPSTAPDVAGNESANVAIADASTAVVVENEYLRLMPDLQCVRDLIALLPALARIEHWPGAGGLFCSFSSHVAASPRP
jgi:hypothetical protein